MKEFVKSKKGKIVIGVVSLLILIGIIYSCSSEKDDKKPTDVTIEQEKGEGSKTQQDNLKDTGNGLEVGDSLSESEDTLSVSGGEDEMNDSVASDKDENLKDDKNPMDKENSEGVEDSTDNQESEDSDAVPKETFGELY